MIATSATSQNCQKKQNKKKTPLVRIDYFIKKLESSMEGPYTKPVCMGPGTHLFVTPKLLLGIKPIITIRGQNFKDPSHLKGGLLINELF
jgi:hypothetical protein